MHQKVQTIASCSMALAAPWSAPDALVRGAEARVIGLRPMRSICGLLLACTTLLLAASCATDCQGARTAVQSRIQALVQQTNACTNTSDCVHVDSETRCSGTCGEIINGANKAAFATGLGKIDAEECGDSSFSSFQASCGSASPSCAAPTPACANGRCWQAP